MIRCRLDARDDASEVRYVPAAEFDLWSHYMASRHERRVEVDDVSVWVPENAAVWDEGIDADRLQPVVRVRFHKPGPRGVPVPVVRFLPTETYPDARAALFGHFDMHCRWTAETTPGYFISSPDGKALSMGGADEDEGGPGFEMAD